MTLIIGIGNRDRGDDGAGPVLAQALARQPGIRVVESQGEPAALLELLGAAHATGESVILIDAAEFDAEPGSILDWDVAAAPLPALGGGTSTHGLGLPEALELARVLGQLPAQCRVYAIRGLDYEAGADLSAPVQAALDELFTRLSIDLATPARLMTDAQPDPHQD